MQLLYRRNHELMYSTARHFLIDKSAVDDILQDCTVKLMQKIPTLRRLNGFQLATYVMYTVKNTSLNHNRRMETERRHIVYGAPDEAEAETVDEAAAPEATILAAEQAEEFHKALNELSATDQTLLIGRYFFDQSDAELAQALGCKEANIRMMLTRARRRAMKLLQERDITL